MQYIIGLCLMLLLLGCGSEVREKQYNGSTLIKEKCALCHNLQMPPSSYENEKAPPMMAVVFHLKDFMKITMNEEKFSTFIPFVKEYVIYPSIDKSFCDKESLKTYGVMPSQKGKVNQEELEAIASYMYDFYDQQKYLKKMQEKAKFDALPKAEQLIIRTGCYNCHGKTEDKAAPSFLHISQKKEKDIIETIKNGSRGQWKGFHAFMPAFKEKFTEEELQTLKAWIDAFSTKKLPIVWKAK